MNRFLLLWLVVWAAWIPSTAAADSGPRILKVLTHLLDEQGRSSVSPGLFERDAYQQQLRENPERVSGVRFDIQWKARGHAPEQLRLRIWARTTKRDPHQPLLLESDLEGNRRWGGWSSVLLTGEPFEKAGEILAWRVVLLDGDQEIAEQKSFLW